MGEATATLPALRPVSAGDLRRRIWFVQVGFGALAVAACIGAPLVGPTTISLRQVFDTTIPFSQNVDAQIFFIARLPRAFAGALVGGSLAAAGVVVGVLFAAGDADIDLEQAASERLFSDVFNPFRRGGNIEGREIRVAEGAGSDIRAWHFDAADALAGLRIVATAVPTAPVPDRCGP